MQPNVIQKNNISHDLSMRKTPNAKISSDLLGQKITVFGLGVSGIFASQLARSLGAKVTVMDHRKEDDFSVSLLEELKVQGIEFNLGEISESKLMESDLIVLSPGVSQSLELFQKVHANSIPLIGELEFASQYIDSPDCSIIAITGTNGKSTTTSLLGRMFQEAGKEVFVGGNLGEPLSKFILSQLQKEKLASKPLDAVILEVSSFQLETIDAFSPEFAVILNIHPDHQDRYKNFEDYISAKERIFSNMTNNQTLLLNPKDSQSESLGEKARMKGIKVEFFKEEERIYPRLPGKHNQENIAAAKQIAHKFQISHSAIEKALQNFKPLRHRLEWVGEFSGISFYNDSKATNPQAVKAALNSFDAPVLWIAGGLNEGGSFEELRPMVRNRVKQAFFIGEAKETLDKCFREDSNCKGCSSLGEALANAFAQASPGEIIVLSPGCKSFDQYKNYQERGDQFCRWVKALIQ